jgi:squalene-associated FAD-dependent desaturase
VSALDAPATDVLVVGGGLAGISSALRCADAGLTVTLLEARPRLGGRTASFHRESPAASGLDAGTGLDVDTGQHVFLRCCEAYLGLLNRLGVRDQVDLQPRLDVPVLSPGARRPVRITRGRAPAPLHLAPALAKYRLLSPIRRLRLARAALALRAVDPTKPATDERSFGEWLTAHGQDAETIAVLWDLITVATLNSPAAESSLALAATVFQLGLLTDASAGDLGWSRVPLGQLHGEAARSRLAEAGVSVRTGVKVLGLDRSGPHWAARLGDATTPEGAPIRARRVLLAAPPTAAEALLPPGTSSLATPLPGSAARAGAPLPSGWAARLASSPIVNVHVIYDRTVLPEPFMAAVGSPVQWIFDRTASSGLTRPANRPATQYLAVSLSAARDLIARPTREVLDLLLPALAELLPAARPAEVLDAFVTREPAATFTPSPGTARLRPGPRTSEPGLYLAGAWTDTGWPDTMESAVRSGNNAATAILADADETRPDLAPEGPFSDRSETDAEVPT